MHNLLHVTATCLDNTLTSLGNTSHISHLTSYLTSLENTPHISGKDLLRRLCHIVQQS